MTKDYLATAIASSFEQGRNHGVNLRGRMAKLQGTIGLDLFAQHRQIDTALAGQREIFHVKAATVARGENFGGSGLERYITAGQQRVDMRGEILLGSVEPRDKLAVFK